MIQIVLLVAIATPPAALGLALVLGRSLRLADSLEPCPDAPDVVLGHLIDEIGGAWSFKPISEAK